MRLITNSAQGNMARLCQHRGMGELLPVTTNNQSELISTEEKDTFNESEKVTSAIYRIL